MTAGILAFVSYVTELVNVKAMFGSRAAIETLQADLYCYIGSLHKHTRRKINASGQRILKKVSSHSFPANCFFSFLTDPGFHSCNTV